MPSQHKLQATTHFPTEEIVDVVFDRELGLFVTSRGGSSRGWNAYLLMIFSLTHIT